MPPDAVLFIYIRGLTVYCSVLLKPVYGGGMPYRRIYHAFRYSHNIHKLIRREILVSLLFCGVYVSVEPGDDFGYYIVAAGFVEYLVEE